MIAERSARLILLCTFILAACSCATRSSTGAKSGYGPVKPASLSDYIRSVYRLSAETSAEEQRRAEVLARVPELAELRSQAGQNPADRSLRTQLIAAYMEHNLYHDAYELLMDSHVSDPDDSETNLDLAKVWDLWGQHDLALQYAERGVSTGSPSARAFELLGRIHLHRNKPAEAVTWFARALDQDRFNASILTNLGYAHMLSSDWEQARGHLEAALKVDPTVPETHNNLAIVLSKLGDEKGALSHLMNAGTPAVALNNMGVLYLQNNKFEAAQHAFQEALRLEPNYELALRNLQAARTATPPPAIIHISSFSPAAAVLSSPEAQAPLPVAATVDTHSPEPAIVANSLSNVAPAIGKQSASDRNEPSNPLVDEKVRAPKQTASHTPVRVPVSKVLRPSHKTESSPARETFGRIVRLEHRGLNIAGLAGAFILTGLVALRPRKSGL